MTLAGGTPGAIWPLGGAMAKSAKKPEPAVEQVFDVAISFLVADERVASTIKSKLAGLNVFFYPHN
jgi:hypothetical protein